MKRRLIKKTKYKIKICGVSSVSDGVAIANLAPDYMGFIINFPKSPRHLEPLQVKEIIEKIKKTHKDIKFVGVFVNQSLEDVKKIVKECGLGAVQLHGQESVGYVKELKGKLKGVCDVWKSIIVKEKADVENSKQYRGVADKILFDAGSGSGNQVDLSLIGKEKIDVLAGGLSVENIESLLSQVNPEIVDANSKLEIEPAKKDINKVKEFIKKVRKINK